MKEDTSQSEFQRTTHPDAQWFPTASFGLFMHWGIHSVPGIQPSWAMIKDYPAGGDSNYHPPEKYYALARAFDPQQYDPDKWLKAAKAAGMTYAVLTSKHHDGYALWPTAYGDLSTRQYLGGRDLLAPFVEACRANGLRVGFYFSPADWHYPNYPIGDVDFDYNQRGTRVIPDLAAHERLADEWYAYTMGQIEELLTRYGKLDLFWFDGGGFPGLPDYRTLETLQRVRELQPHIVVNNRWGHTGDYTTPECRFTDERPTGWWELCHIWQGGHGGWGYSHDPHYRPLTWVMETLVRCRAWGGNFLCNVGPSGEGVMHPLFYEGCAQLAEWMAHSRESVIGAGPTPGDDRANVPITARAGTWYLHLLPEHVGEAVVDRVPRPARVQLLRTGEELPHTHAGGQLRLTLTAAQRTPLNDVVKVTWE